MTDEKFLREAQLILIKLKKDVESINIESETARFGAVYAFTINKDEALVASDAYLNCINRDADYLKAEAAKHAIDTYNELLERKDTEQFKLEEKLGL